MTGRTNRLAVDQLADVLVEDILNTPEDQLLAEVAEDHGNPRALAETFDRIALRARSNDRRLATRVLPAAATRLVVGSSERKSHPAVGQRTFWQNAVQAILDAIFPGRLVMIAVSSACIASLGFIVAAPALLDWMQEQKPVVANEGGAPSMSPAVPSFRGLDLPLHTDVAEERPAAPISDAGRSKEGGAVQQNAASSPLETASAPLTAMREPLGHEASRPTTDSYVVQISMERTKANAESTLRKLQAKFANELNDHKTMIRTDLGANGVYYRALVGPFGSVADADRFCSVIKPAGTSCTIQKE